MEMLHHISAMMGTECFSTEICQIYLDQPLIAIHDNADVLVPVVSAETLRAIIKEILSCNLLDLSDPNIIIHAKRIATGAIMTMNSSSDADGSSAYGVSNSGVLSAVTICIGKLATIVLKAPTKKSSQKEIDISEEKKKKLKEKKTLKKEKKLKFPEKFDDEEEEDDDDEDCLADSDDEVIEDKEKPFELSQLSQSSQSSQLFDETELTEIPTLPGRNVGPVSYQALKKLLLELKNILHLYIARPEEMLLESAINGLVAVLFLSSAKTEFSNLKVEVLAAITHIGISSELALLLLYRSLMPALSTAGRDIRLPDGSKIRIICHKVAVQVVLALIEKTPEITWGTCIFTQHVSNADFEVTKEAEKMVDSGVGEEELECLPENEMENEVEKDIDKLSVPFICVLGMLQRITVKVPDKAQSRLLILGSVISVLNALQEVKTKEDKEDDLRLQIPQGYCYVARLTVIKYLSFLQKLSKSNKIGYRAFALDIITECMTEEWLWSVPLKSTDLDLIKGNNVTDNSNFYARSLLSMVLNRCDDVAPTVRLRALGALSGLLSKLKEKGHDNPIGMCTSILDLALGFLDDKKENESDLEDTKNNGVPGKLSPKSARSPRSPSSKMKTLQSSPVTPKVSVQKIGLFEILRLRVNDDKPLVRVKAIQTLGSALGLNYPKRKQRRNTSTCISASSSSSKSRNSSRGSLAYQDEDRSIDIGDYGEEDAGETVSMLITPDDVAVFFNMCSDVSLSTRKQALSSLSELMLSRPANIVLQDAWVTGCLPLATDAESSVQAKLAQCTYDLIINPSVTWAKKVQSSSPRLGRLVATSESELVWQLCNKISETGGTKLLRTTIGIMLKQGILKAAPVCTDRGFEGTALAGKNSMSTVLQAVKTACCHDSEVVSRGGWILLEALTDCEESSTSLTTSLTSNAEYVAPALSSFSRNSKDTGDGSNALPFIDTSSNFVYESFFKRQDAKQQSQGMAGSEQTTIVLDEDDERILKVMKKVTDSLSLTHLSRTKTFLLSVLQNLQFSSSICTVAISTVFAISKSVARTTSREYKNIGEEERGLLLQKLWYSDVQRWAGELLLSVYRATHTAVWAQEIEEIVLYELFSSDSARDSGRMDSIKLPPLSDSKKSALLSTFEADTKGNSNSFDNSFWNEKTTGQTKDHSSANSQAGKDIVISAMFLLGEISMLGFSLEEDESVTAVSPRKSSYSRLPGYTISEISKSFKIILPKKIVLLTQILMSPYLPCGNERDTFSPSLSQTCGGDLHLSQNSQFCDNASSGRECSAVIRAHAFVVMGKFCLRDRTMARNHVNVFLRELHNPKNDKDTEAVSRPSNPSVRSNALFVLGDMCVRYTNLVDRHIGALAGCLQDSSVMVRRHALILLTQLLLQDFIKWRGLLLFRFLATAIDKDEEMAELSRSVLKKTLSVKYPDFFAVHFTETLLVLNNCEDHPVYVSVASSGADGDSCPVNMEGVDLTGPKKRNARLRLYGFMMADFSEEQKIQVTAKIVQDMLSYAVDYLRSNNSNGGAGSGAQSRFEEALRDAFLVLSSPLLKVGRKSNASLDKENEEDEELEEAGGGIGKAVEKAKITVLKKLSLQHLLLHMLPVVTSLKNVLETNKSHLQRALMNYLITLVKSHKTEVFQAMSMDPSLKDLKAEIEYEMKVSEKNQKDKIIREQLESENFIFDWEAVANNADQAGEPTVSSPRASGIPCIPGPGSRLSMGSSKSTLSNKSLSPKSSERTDPRSVRIQTPGKKLLIQTPLKAGLTWSKSGLRFVAMNGAGDKNDEDGENDVGDNDDDTDVNKEKRSKKKENKTSVEGGTGEEVNGGDVDIVEDPAPFLSIQSRRRSWGVSVPDLHGNENVNNTNMKNQIIPSTSSQDILKNKKTRSLLRKSDTSQCGDESQIRFTPKKKLMKN